MSTVQNVTGGSAGAGGYNFQAKVFALVASKMLNGSPLAGWAQLTGSGVPIWISSEVGGGGDDLRVGVFCGSTIDIQVKRGLRRGTDLWNALITLAKHVVTARDAYGVLLVDPSTSGTIKSELANDVIRIGTGRTDNISEIGIEFENRILVSGLDPMTVCARLRIIERDMRPGGAGEAEALGNLYPHLTNVADAPTAFLVLETDGHMQIEKRLKRTQSDLAIHLGRHVSLSKKSQTMAIARAALICWQAEVYEFFEVPPVGLKLPIRNAWMRLAAMSFRVKPEPDSLAESISAYHEWYRLAETRSTVDHCEVEGVIGQHPRVVFVGGPGAGKSTLARRATLLASERGELALRVPLGILATRLRSGDSFMEALEAVTLSSYSVDTETIRAVLRTANVLIADGLDEADPSRSNVAEELTKWALADDSRRVIVTTRAIGHNSNWFSEWPHYEIQPLDWVEVRAFVRTVAEAIEKNESAQLLVNSFEEALASSRTATIASRNPQLLSFLLALHMAKESIAGSRYELFESMLRLALRTSLQDGRQEYLTDEPLAWRVLQLVAWLTLTEPGLDEMQIVERLGTTVSEDIAEPPLKAKRLVASALRFWADRRILERLSVGDLATYTFVHMALAEFGAAQYLVDLPAEDMVVEIRNRAETARFRQTFAQLGSTDRADIAIQAVLGVTNAADPISIAPLLAAEMLTEGKGGSSSRDSVVSVLTTRLSSPIQDVAFEACEKLHPIAFEVAPVVGPIAHALMTHDQPWTSKVATALAPLRYRICRR